MSVLKKPDANDEGLQKFRIEDAHAQVLLVMRMKQESLSHVLMCETAYEMWIKLQTRYNNQFNLRFIFYNSYLI